MGADHTSEAPSAYLMVPRPRTNYRRAPCCACRGSGVAVECRVSVYPLEDGRAVLGDLLCLTCRGCGHDGHDQCEIGVHWDDDPPAAAASADCHECADRGWIIDVLWEADLPEPTTADIYAGRDDIWVERRPCLCNLDQARVYGPDILLSGVPGQSSPSHART